MKTLQIILAATLLAAPTLHGQIVADGTTNTLSNVSTNITGDVTVGANGSFTLLILSDNALLNNSANGVIGLNANAKSNAVHLVSPSARWLMAGEMYVGSDGAFSRLVVSNGGLVGNDDGFLAASFSSNNEAVVTGAGSFWSNRLDLHVGYLGRGNRLVITNGGLVESRRGFMGYFVSSSNNEAVVTGAGSIWSNRGEVDVGYEASGNRLVISNVGQVVNNDGFIGFNATSRTNTVLVTDSGSTWNNLTNLIVGNRSSGNALIASNGAVVTVGGDSVIGVNTGANSNLATVTGPGTSWLMASNLYVGSNGAFNRLTISNGALVKDIVGLLGSMTGTSIDSSNNTALVTGPGSVWSNSSSLFVGWNGAGNRLVIDNGGRVSSGSGALGVSFFGTNSTVLVAGAGSAWNNSSSLIVGNIAPGCRMVVSNSAFVDNGAGSIGEFDSGSSDCEVVVTGSGSVWSNRTSLTVGKSARSARLVVTNGGSVFSLGDVRLGENVTSTNNSIVVAGGTLRATNAAGTATLDLRRGTNQFNAGAIEADRLLMTSTQAFFEFNGGLLTTRGAFITNGAPFVVGGPGSIPAIWDVRAGVSNYFFSGELYVGSNSSLNQLVLTNGALLTNNGYGYLGLNSGANSNTATLAGAGSRWSLSGVFVGVFGSGNRLVVSNGATVLTSSSSVLGYDSSCSSNEAVITGPGTSWMNLSQLFVGYDGRDHRLRVDDGALLTSAYASIGGVSTATNNLALVTGLGSSWSSNDQLRVGDSGAGNQLVVSNNAVVSAVTAVSVGFYPTALRNRLTVDGGTLRVTNATVTGVLDVRRGTNVLNAGLVDVDVLRLTNTLGFFEFNGGTLSVKGSSVNNGQLFRVGNGVSPATLTLVNGNHSYLGGLIISSNAAVTGNGLLVGPLTVQPGGLLSPGTSIGGITLFSASSPLLQGTVVMELSKNGTALTSDQLQVTGALTYGGALIVTNLGPTALARGDSFQLFPAGSHAGSFSAITLPPLEPALEWTNKLSVDGSIEVVGVSLPKFSSIKLSGTNVILSGTGGTPNAPYAVLTATNVTTPLSNWLSIVTNQFDSGGGFSFTNGIPTGEPQRYFRIRTP